MAIEQDPAIYHEVAGGPELLHWFGEVPSFHDAEILDVHLCRNGESYLRLHGWVTSDEVTEGGQIVLDRHAVVTFTLHGIMDLQLDAFSEQNVIGRLILRRAPDRQERRGYLALEPRPQDIELELEPCYGLRGLIHARSVAITIKPGEPEVYEA